MNKHGDIDRLFDGRHFDREVIVLCVRWYGHTLAEALEQAAILSDVQPKIAVVDRGYKGIAIDGVKIYRTSSISVDPCPAATRSTPYVAERNAGNALA
ncbi:hypothetical protein LJR230_001338 [Trinickia sp. LjRoot230]